VRAVETSSDDPVPHGEVTGVASDFNDGARALITHNVRKRVHYATKSIKSVAALNADCFDLDKKFAVPDCWIGYIFIAKDVGTPRFIIDSSFHWWFLVLGSCALISTG
jgi:hypothetical protein